MSIFGITRMHGFSKSSVFRAEFLRFVPIFSRSDMQASLAISPPLKSTAVHYFNTTPSDNTDFHKHR